VIIIPIDPGNIQGRPLVQQQPDPRMAAAETAGAPVEYTVKPGDTLSRIARNHYGSVAYKDLIFRANRDRLRSEDSLQVGQKLRLPPKPD
jgi:nucleoid-associated protein YgaU